MSGRRKTPGDGQLSPEDRRLWAQVTRDVTPLRDRPAITGTGKDRARQWQRQQPEPGRTAPGLPLPPPEPLLPGTGGTGSAGVDRRRYRQLGRGNQPPDSRIDLHGLDRAAAYAQLVRHLEAAAMRGERCVLVITGKGGRRFTQRGDVSPEFRRRADFATGKGILRNAVPHWLDSVPLNGLVSGYALAHARHGGEGAFYVMLRRRR